MTTIKAFLLAKIVMSKEAPEITKNNIKIGGVINSILSKTLSESFLKLTSIAPIIIDDNKAEIEISAPIRSLKFIKDKPTQMNIEAIHMMIRLDLDLNNLQPRETSRPSNPPTRILLKIETNGQTNKSKTLGFAPFAIAFEIENKIEKAINATASSKATTGSNVLTTGPSALYCLITIKVAAGAVAHAIAPKVRIISTGM